MVVRRSPCAWPPLDELALAEGVEGALLALLLAAVARLAGAVDPAEEVGLGGLRA